MVVVVVVYLVVLDHTFHILHNVFDVSVLWDEECPLHLHHRTHLHLHLHHKHIPLNRPAPTSITMYRSAPLTPAPRCRKAPDGVCVCGDVSVVTSQLTLQLTIRAGDGPASWLFILNTCFATCSETIAKPHDTPTRLNRTVGFRETDRGLLC